MACERKPHEHSHEQCRNESRENTATNVKMAAEQRTCGPSMESVALLNSCPAPGHVPLLAAADCVRDMVATVSGDRDGEADGGMDGDGDGDVGGSGAEANDAENPVPSTLQREQTFTQSNETESRKYIHSEE